MDKALGYFLEVKGKSRWLNTSCASDVRLRRFNMNLYQSCLLEDRFHVKKSKENCNDYFGQLQNKSTTAMINIVEISLKEQTTVALKFS